MVKSPLRYPGGKSKVINKIIELVPEFEEFREPFVGGGSLFIYLKQQYPEKKIWINDLYQPLFKFWQICQLNLSGVFAQVMNWKQRFSDGKELHRFLTENYTKFNDVEKASAFFVLNRITFSGTSDSGGYSEQAFRKRFTMSSVDRLRELESVLLETRITDLDYEKVVSAEGRNVFIFLDPPYYSTKNSGLYGKNGHLHKSFDHEIFAETMKKCKYKWLITYDDSEFIRKLFSFANIKSWNLTYGMRNVTSESNQIGKELFISNYSFKKVKRKENSEVSSRQLLQV